MTEPADDGWTTLLRAAEGLGRSPSDVPGLIGVTVRLGLRELPGAVGCSVTVLDRHGRYSTAASAGGPAVDLDNAQYDSGEGPCLEALVEGRQVRLVVDEIEPGTFQAFHVAAQLALVESSLSIPVTRSTGLNVYSRTAEVWAGSGAATADLLARALAAVLGEGDGIDQDQARRVQEAARRRGRNRAAVQRVATAEGISEEEAFNRLASRSADVRRPLEEVVDEVLGLTVDHPTVDDATGDREALPPPDDGDAPDGPR